MPTVYSANLINGWSLIYNIPKLFCISFLTGYLSCYCWSWASHNFIFFFRTVFHFSFTLAWNKFLCFSYVYMGFFCLFVCLYGISRRSILQISFCWAIVNHHLGLCVFDSFPWFLFWCSMNSWRGHCPAFFYEVLFMQKGWLSGVCAMPELLQFSSRCMKVFIPGCLLV